MGDDQTASNRIAVWKESEDVAKHFNDLIMNFRLKALSGIAIGAGLFVNLLSNDKIPAVQRDSVLAGALWFLFAIWAAFFVIDTFYYQLLLAGAVKEVKRLEQQSGDMMRLSTTIEEEANKIGISVLGRKWPRYLFYLLPGVALLVPAIKLTKFF